MPLLACGMLDCSHHEKSSSHNQVTQAPHCNERPNEANLVTGTSNQLMLMVDCIDVDLYQALNAFQQEASNADTSHLDDLYYLRWMPLAYQLIKPQPIRGSPRLLMGAISPLALYLSTQRLRI